MEVEAMEVEVKVEVGACTWRLFIPPRHFLCALPYTPNPPKMDQKGRFLGQNSVFDQNSKELFELLKYFVGFGPFF